MEELKNKYVSASELWKLLAETRRTPEEKLILIQARLAGGHLKLQDLVAMRGAGAFQRARSIARQKGETKVAFQDYDNLVLEPEVCPGLAPKEINCDKCAKPPKPAKRAAPKKAKPEPGANGGAAAEGSKVRDE